jgi:predicted outer membrane lipoprotein
VGKFLGFLGSSLGMSLDIIAAVLGGFNSMLELDVARSLLECFTSPAKVNTRGTGCAKGQTYFCMRSLAFALIASLWLHAVEHIHDPANGREAGKTLTVGDTPMQPERRAPRLLRG